MADQPAWASSLVVEVLETALAGQIDTASHAGAQLDPTEFAAAVITALADEDLVIAPDQHADVTRYRDAAGDFRWRATDDQNGQIIATSGEGYVSTTHCAHMAQRIFPTATTATEAPTT